MVVDKKILAILFIVGNLLFISCSEEEPFEVRFFVDVSADSFDASGGSKSIALTSNVSWSASSNQEWLTVTPASGPGNATITITATENNTSAARAGVVVLTPETGDAIKINISQVTNHEFTVDALEVLLEAHQEKATINLHSKSSWQATSSDDWLTVNPESGTGDATLTFTASSNEEMNERSAVVTLTPDVGEAIEIEVIQKGRLFSVDTYSVSFEAAPGEQTIVLQTNTSWIATSSERWLTAVPGEGAAGGDQTLLIDVTRNNSTDKRAATLTITSELDQRIEIEVLQEAADYSSDLTRYVAPDALGSGSGKSETNAADFSNASFWAAINTELQSGSVEVIFLAGDYSKAYVNAGAGTGLALDRIGNEDNRLTLTGGKDVVFKALEGYSTRGNLIRLHGSQNITFRDFNFTGDGAINYVLAIRSPEGFPPSRNILIENCTWYDMLGIVYGATGCHYEGTSNITYKGCSFKRIGLDGGAHMMYNAYGPQNIQVINCYFEDCMGDYVRFRDRTEFGMVKNSRFVRTMAFPDVAFISIPCFNNQEPGNEFFGTNFAFTGNHFDNNAYSNTSRAITFAHRGFTPPGYRYLPSLEDSRILRNGTRAEKLEQFKINFGIDLEKVRIVDNTFSNRITYTVALNTAAAYGAVSNGWVGTLDIANLVYSSNTPFDWEKDSQMPGLPSTNIPQITPEFW